MKRIYKAKYLGPVFNQFLDWGTHFHQLDNNLKRGFGLHTKIRHETSKHL